MGISTERSLEMVVGLLGILKGGCAYVPLDPGDPAERREFVIRERRSYSSSTLSCSRTPRS